MVPVLPLPTSLYVNVEAPNSLPAAHLPLCLHAAADNVDDTDVNPFIPLVRARPDNTAMYANVTLQVPGPIASPSKGVPATERHAEVQAVSSTRSTVAYLVRRFA